MWRWCTQGVGPGKTRLEHIRMGRRICTSREALDRFFAASAAASVEHLTPPRPAPEANHRNRSPKERTASINAALQSLERHGVIDGQTRTEIAGRVEHRATA
jgi:hypothetical protein